MGLHDSGSFLAGRHAAGGGKAREAGPCNVTQHLRAENLMAEYPSATFVHRCGEWLFQHRSCTPVPLAALIVATAWLAPAPFAESRPADWLLRAAAIGLLILGETIRLGVAGRARRGTSCRGTRFKASMLVTGGMYAYTRNPLYLANLLLWTGAALLTLALPVVLIAVTATAVQYHLIIVAEERFLLTRYGRQYAEFCRGVPRLFPRLVLQRRTHNVVAPPAPFDWRRALFREHDTIYLIVLGAWAMLGLSLALAAEGLGLYASIGWHAIPATATLAWLTTKWVKHSQCPRPQPQAAGSSDDFDRPRRPFRSTIQAAESQQPQRSKQAPVGEQAVKSGSA